MAKRKDLKKFVDTLTYEVIADCFILQEIKPTTKEESLMEIMTKVTEKRNEVISKICMYNKQEEKVEPAKYFKDLSTDFINQIDDSFKKLSKLSKA